MQAAAVRPLRPAADQLAEPPPGQLDLRCRHHNSHQPLGRRENTTVRVCVVKLQLMGHLYAVPR